jgi:hypothetical protein
MYSVHHAFISFRDRGLLSHSPRSSDQAFRLLLAGQILLADQITLASLLSRCTSSSTLATLVPDLRLGGSLTSRVFSCGETSTPRSAGLACSIGFFLAFKAFGSETNLRVSRGLGGQRDNGRSVLVPPLQHTPAKSPPIRSMASCKACPSSHGKAPRGVEPQVSGDDRRQVDQQRLEPAIDFPGHLGLGLGCVHLQARQQGGHRKLERRVKGPRSFFSEEFRSLLVFRRLYRRTSILEAKVAWGHPKRPASICPV